MIKSRGDLAKYFNQLGFKRGAEIGVAHGLYSEVLCQAMPDVELYCIDLWAPYVGGNRGKKFQHRQFARAEERLSSYRAKLVKKTSVEASLDFDNESLDFVFIDGDHLFDYVMTDIILWTRKVRSGGIVSGHDYSYRKDYGVITAVNTYTQVHRQPMNLTPVRRTSNSGDRCACWWFIKK